MGEMNEQLQQYAVELVEAVKGVAPEVLDIAVRITRLSALGDVVLGIILLVALRFSIPFLLRAGRSAFKHEFEAVGKQILIIFGWVGAGCVGLATAICLLNVWTWVGVFAPELRLARDALSRLVTGP